MFVLGLLLILLSAGMLVAVLASGTDDQAALYGGSIGLPTLVVFLAGAAALLLFIMGLELVRSGAKRANQNRRNSKRLRRLERDGGPTSQAGTTQAGTTQPGTTQPGTTQPGTTQAGTTQAGTTQAGTTADPEGPYQTPPPAR
jgi:hypothetical protein